MSAVFCSFWKPRGVFESRFNKVAAYLTSGPFCHVDLVVKVPAETLRSIVSEIYMNPTCEKHLRDTIEECMFSSSSFRSENTLFVAFSALWGNKLVARILKPHALNIWEHEPINFSTNNDIVTWVDTLMFDDDVHEVLKFAVRQLGKDYALLPAIVSATSCRKWLSAPSHRKTSYFCSELCVSALQAAGMLENVEASMVTPNDLYNMIQ